MLRIYHTAFSCLLALTLTCALFACQEPPPAEPPVMVEKKPVEPVYNTADYIHNLALAKLEPSSRPASIKVINSYTGQNTHSEELQRVLTIDYKLPKNKKMEQVATSLPMDKNQMDYPRVENILRLLEKQGATLHKLEIGATRVVLQKDMAISLTDRERSAKALQEQQQRVVSASEKLAVREEIEVQLNLIEFFYRHRFRDAAYLGLSNAKQLLAHLSTIHAKDDPILKQLYTRLQQVESDVRQSMPYSL